MSISLNKSKKSSENSENAKSPEGFLPFDVFEMVITALFVITLVFVFLFRVVEVKGASMKPTLQDGDKLIVTALGYTPERGDIVIISGNSQYEKSIVKRVIAVGGDVVDIDFETGVVTVNGEGECFQDGITFLQYDVSFPLTVEPGTVFVLGDNRGDSLDSRSSTIGCVDEKRIVGKAVGRIYPFGRWSIYD